jgi:hypothetical protein
MINTEISVPPQSWGYDEESWPKDLALRPPQGVMSAAMWPLECWNRGKMEGWG